MKQKNSLLTNLAKSCVDAVRDFPVALFYMTVGVVVFSLPDVPYYVATKYGNSAIIACVGSLAASLATNGLRRWVVIGSQLLTLAIAFMYLLVFDTSGLYDGYYSDNNLETINSAAAYFLASLAIVFFPFWKGGDDCGLRVWSTTMRGITGVLRAALVALCVFLAMMVITTAGEALLGVKIFDRFWLTFLPFQLFGALSIAAFSTGGAREGTVFRLAPFSNGVFTFISVPLLAIYLSIFYIYLIDVLVTGVNPVRDVSYQAVGVFLAFCIQRYVFQSALAEGKNTVALWFNKLSPWLLLLPVFMVTWVVARQLSRYGITVSRLYLVIINIWMYGVVIWWIATKGRKVWVMPVSLCAAIFLSSVMVINVTSVTVTVMRSQLESAMLNAGWELPANSSFYDTHATKALSAEERSIKTYLYDEAGQAGLDGLVEMPEAAKRSRQRAVEENQLYFSVRSKATFSAIPENCIAVNVYDYYVEDVAVAGDSLILNFKDAGGVMISVDEMRKLYSQKVVAPNCISVKGVSKDIRGAVITYLFFSGTMDGGGALTDHYCNITATLFIGREAAEKFIE